MENGLRHLNALRCFEAAARLKSYSKAGEELFVTQAAISQQIRGLEKTLGSKLFYRQGREMLLTAQGEILANHVTTGFDHILTGLNRAQCEPLNGSLTVTTTPSFASRWLMPKLWRFTMKYPEIPIKVIASPTEDDLRHSGIDIAIRQGQVNSPNLHNHFLYEEPVFPICSPELATSLKLTKPEQLTKCWLIHGINSVAFTWAKWFEKAKVPYDEKQLLWMEVTTFDMGLNAVMAGHGVCLGTMSLAGDFIEKGLLVKPFDIGLTPGVRYTLLHNEHSPRLKRINVFKEWVNEEVELIKKQQLTSLSDS